jgi:hypothetical protein
MAQTQFSNASNTLAVVLGTNQIVERCFAKMANDVTAQVRDKLIDIILAVIARECEDFDVELLRRLINAEIPDPTITVEKRVKTQDPESKTKTKTKTVPVVELDAEGNPIKRARKEKAPKAAKEPKAPKAAMTEEEKAALKAEKEAAKAAEKEARTAAKQLEREAAKAAKALADAEKPAKEPKVKAPKEVRIPIPWCGVAIADRCQALRSYHGLFAQCTADNTETCLMCPACEKAGAPFGTVAMRAACGVFDYTAPNGKKCIRLANVIDKFGLADAAEQAFHEEAAKHDITIPHEHFEKEVKQRGRPKSLSPRATKGKGKVATTDTTPASSRNASDADNSDTETETDEPVTVAAAAKAPKATGEKKQKQQQARKKVEKTADAAADAEAPKKRGRPAKAKEPAVEVNESLIQDLVSSASGRASDAAPSSVEQELTEDIITPIAASPATPAKKAASPVTAPAAPKKASALKKKTRVTEDVEGMTMWVESFEGNKIWVNPENLAVYDASNGEGVGTWDDAAKTIKFDDDEETEIDQFSEEE